MENDENQSYNICPSCNMVHNDDEHWIYHSPESSPSRSSTDSRPSSPITLSIAFESVTPSAGPATSTAVPEAMIFDEVSDHPGYHFAGSVVRSICIGTGEEIDVLFELMTRRRRDRQLYSTEDMTRRIRPSFSIRTLADLRHEIHFINGNASIIIRLEPRSGLFKYGSHAMSEEEIEAIPTLAVTREMIDEMEMCSICLEDLMYNEEIKKLSCNHIFHAECVNTWLQLSNFCPFCRRCQSVNNPIPEPVNDANFREELRSAMCDLIILFGEPGDARLFCPSIRHFTEYLADTL